MDRIYIAGCPIDRVGIDEVRDSLLDAIDRREGIHVSGVNAHSVVSATKDKAYLGMLEATPIVVVDSFWVAVAARLLGHRDVTTIGIERLVYELLYSLSDTNGTVFLLGTKEEIVHNAAENIQQRYPGVEVVGARNGYFADADEDLILAEMNASRPDVVLVGMTSPKKEEWMAKHGDRIHARVTIGVGGVLDILGNAKPTAPIWVKEIGMEWLFRLVNDPKRLLKRYTVGNTQFIWLVLRDFVSKQLRNTASG